MEAESQLQVTVGVTGVKRHMSFGQPATLRVLVVVLAVVASLMTVPAAPVAADTAPLSVNEGVVDQVVVAPGAPIPAAPGHGDVASRPSVLSGALGARLDGPEGLVAGNASAIASGPLAARLTHSLRHAVRGLVVAWGGVTVEVDPGIVSTEAGDGVSHHVDGTATAAGFTNPSTVTFASGSLFIGDGTAIRQMNPATGVVSTIAGDPTEAGCVVSQTPGDVRFTEITAIASDGTSVFVLETGCTGSIDYSLLEVDVATGSSSQLATVNRAVDVTVPGDGYVYVLRGESSPRVDRIDPATGAATEVWSATGTSYAFGLASGAASVLAWTDASQSVPHWGTVTDIPLDGSAASVVVADVPVRLYGLEVAGDFAYGFNQAGTKLYRVDLDGSSEWTVVAGSGTAGYADGVGAEAWFAGATGVASDGLGLWVTDAAGHTVRAVRPAGLLPWSQPEGTDVSPRMRRPVVLTLAGDGTAGTIDGDAKDARFEDVVDVVVANNIAYVAQEDVIRTVDLTTGDVATLAGTAGTTGCTDHVDPALVTFDVELMVTDGYWLYVVNDSCGTASSYRDLRRVSTVNGATSTIGEVSRTHDLTVAPDRVLYTAGTYTPGIGASVIDPVRMEEPYHSVETYLPASADATNRTLRAVAADDTYLWMGRGYLNNYGTGWAYFRRYDPATEQLVAVDPVSGSIPDGKYLSAGDFVLTGSRDCGWTCQFSGDPSPEGFYRIAKTDGSSQRIVDHQPFSLDPTASGLGELPTSRAGFAWTGESIVYFDVEHHKLRMVIDAYNPPGAFALGWDGYGAWRSSVNSGLGNFVHSETDATVPGVGPALEVTRTYNSADPMSHGFGPGWSHTYAMQAQEYGNGDVVVIFPDGRRETHTPDGQGGYTPPDGYFTELTGDTTNGWTLNHKDDTVTTFNPDGQLVSIADNNGRTLSLTYDGNDHLDQVTAASGRTLDFTWTDDHITSVATDPVGGSALVWKYYYDTDDRLVATCDARDNTQTGICTTYSHDANSRITEITKPEGNTAAKVAYDVSGRVLWREDGEANTTTWTPIDETTIDVTDARGLTSRQIIDDDYRLVEEIYPNSAGNPGTTSTTYSYDTDGNRNGVTDANANTSQMVYDTRGNLTEVTNGENETSYFEYNTSDDLIWSADGRSTSRTDTTYRTTFTYDAAGNKLTETTPLGDTTRWVYTDGTEAAVDTGTVPAGLLERHIEARGQAPGADPDDYAADYGYYQNGDLATVTTPSGLVTTYTYDEVGRVATETVTDTIASTTAVTTYTYDQAGNTLTVTRPLVTNLVTSTDHQLRVSYVYDDNSNVTSMTEVDIAGSDPSRVTTYGYDLADREISVTDPEGGVLSRSYDFVGNVVSVTDQNGVTTATTYDHRNLPVTVTLKDYDDGLGSPTRDITLTAVTYDDAGRKLTETDAEGRVTRWSYDAADRVTQVVREDVTSEDPTQSTRDVVLSATTYDNAGNILTQTSGDGVNNQSSVTSTYDAAGRVATSTVTVGAGSPDRVTTFSYDAAGNAIRIDLTDGTTTESTASTYDVSGWVATTTIDPAGLDLTTTYGYDQRGNLSSVTNPLGNTVSTVFDELNRPSTVTAPQVEVVEYGGTPTQTSPETTTGYNTYGDATHVVDANGNVTVSSFDKLSRVTQITHPSYTAPTGVCSTGCNPTETFVYDAVGNLTSETSRRGHTTTFVFNDFNLVATHTDPAIGTDPAGVTTYTYDDVGNLLSVTDQVGAETRYGYDESDRVATHTAVVRVSGGPDEEHVTRFGYDDLNNQTYLQEPSTAVTRSDYNQASELIEVTDALNQTITYAYDLARRQIEVVDQVGRITEYSYDAAGRMTTMEERAPDETLLATTSYGYDDAGNQTSVTTPRGYITSYTYDDLNRLTDVTGPVDATTSITTSYGYDAAGNHTQFVDGRNNTTWYTYTPWHLQEDIVEPSTTQHPGLSDRTWTVSYDAGGLAVHETQPGGVTVTRSFDELGRLTDESGTGGGTTAATRGFGYDAATRMTSIDHPAGIQTFTYDDRGLLTDASGPAGNATLQYDGNGRLTSRTDAAGTATFTWTARNELASIADPLTGETVTYTWTDAAQPATVTYGTGGPVRTYTYDDQGRLDTDTLKAGTTTLAAADYEYDLDGNVISRLLTLPGNAATGLHTYDYDRAGRLTEWDAPNQSAVTYTWDASGNRTAAGSDTYSYDQRNRMVTGPDGTYTHTPRGTLTTITDGGNTTTYSFDALGRLIDYDGTVTYAYDSLDRVATRNTDGFEYTGMWLDPTDDGAFLYLRSPGGRLIAQTNGATDLFTGLDRHGDVTWLLNPTIDTITDTQVYDPFGDPHAASGTTSPTVGFQGDYTDPTSNETWMGARWYSGADAAFRSRDTIQGELRTPISLNRYTYGFANPLAYWDPDGRYSEYIEGLDGPALQGNSAAVHSRTTRVTREGDQRRNVQRFRSLFGDDNFAQQSVLTRESSISDDESAVASLLRASSLHGPRIADRDTSTAHQQFVGHLWDIASLFLDDDVVEVSRAVRQGDSLPPTSIQGRHLLGYEHDAAYGFIHQAAWEISGLRTGELLAPPNVPFTDRNNPFTPLRVRDVDQPRYTPGNSGWNPLFVDQSVSPATHFMGWAALGYEFGDSAVTALLTQEQPIPDDPAFSQADVESGMAAIELGIALKRGDVDIPSFIRSVEAVTGDPTFGGLPAGQVEYLTPGHGPPSMFSRLASGMASLFES